MSDTLQNYINSYITYQKNVIMTSTLPLGNKEYIIKNIDNIINDYTLKNITHDDMFLKIDNIITMFIS
jgi:hypothetical protein